ncbi:MAG: DUF2339 domain-containing protein [Luteitalea sp.]|nr:DUF2339 domain-containing protein [Luteitalea sp.]
MMDLSYSLLLLLLFGCLLLVLITTTGALVRAARALDMVDHLERELRALGDEVRQLSERVEALPAASPPRTDEEPAESARDDETWRETVRRMQAATPSPESEVTSPQPMASAEAANVVAGGSPEAAIAPGVPGISLERRIVAQWFLYIGMALMALGSVWMFEYLVSRDWLGAAALVATGAVLGLGLLALGERAAIGNRPTRSRLLIGVALVMLYASAWMIGPGSWMLSRWPAFALLTSVSGLAFIEAARHRSLVLTLIALATAFATPVLIGPEHSPLALFVYLGVLGGVARWLARRGRWPLVDVSAYVLTVCVLIWWSERAFTRDQWWMLELFLTAYLALFLIAWRETWKATTRHARLAGIALASAPVAYHLASVAILLPHPAGWLVYAITATLAGLVAAARLGSHLVRWLTFAAVSVPLMAWCYASLDGEWFVAGVVAIVAVSALHVVSEWEALGERPVTGTEIALSHLNAWWAFFALGLLLAPRSVLWPAFVGVPLVAAHVVLAACWWRRYLEAARHHLGIALAVGATVVALWAGGFAPTVALAVEGVVLLSLGASRTGLRTGGEVLLALACFNALRALSTQTSLLTLPLVNHRAGPTLVVAAALVIAWWRLGRGDRAGSRRTALLLGAHVLIILALTMEGAVWLQQRAIDAAVFEASTSARSWQTARLLGPTLLWASYGWALVAAGIWRQHAALRYLGVTLVILALTKLCVIDFPTIGPVARLVIALLLGILLLTMAYLSRRAKGGPDPLTDEEGRASSQVS